MKIGKVAKEAGISVEAIRFYEKKGLIDPPRRQESGYRNYTPDIIEHLQFINKTKELGFSLKEIKELIKLHSAPNTTCRQVKEQAQIKIVDIEKKIKILQKIKKSLTALVSACPGTGPVSGCPILQIDAKQGRKDND